jgi:hypothetical protein
MNTVARQLDTTELEERVKRMYQEVALEPEHEFHFETGRALAERLGYPSEDLDRIPAGAIESFAVSATSSIWPPSSRVKRYSTLAAARAPTASSPRSRPAQTDGSSAST